MAFARLTSNSPFGRPTLLHRTNLFPPAERPVLYTCLPVLSYEERPSLKTCLDLSWERVDQRQK